jgi:hypothetical protein
VTDWIDDLTPDERAGWDDFVAHVRRDAVRKIDGSAFVVSLFPSSGEPDVKYAVELGLSIMLDKPILVVAMPGAKIPNHLAQVADRLVYADIDLEAGRRKVADAIAEMHPDT